MSWTLVFQICVLTLVGSLAISELIKEWKK